MKKNGRCNESCPHNTSNRNPIDVARNYLSNPNDVNVFPFFCMFVIPLYERETGERDTMKKIAIDFRRAWNKLHGESKSEYI